MILISLALVGTTVFATQQVLKAADPLLKTVGFIDAQELERFAETAQAELSIATSRGQEIGTQAQQVLGVAIAPASEDKALHEKAFEYGRYLYCQEVIKQYEVDQKE